LPLALLTPANNSKFDIGVVDYWWQNATGVIDTGKFAAGAVDTSGKFAININNTSGIGGQFATDGAP
jgi:hypothetical protein